MGALLGDDVVEAGLGDLVSKPRGQWHTFWNAGDEPARNPGDHLPRRLRAVLRRARAPDRRWRARPEAFGELCDRYAPNMRDMRHVPLPRGR
jgi:hypothetical protein